MVADELKIPVSIMRDEDVLSPGEGLGNNVLDTSSIRYLDSTLFEVQESKEVMLFREDPLALALF